MMEAISTGRLGHLTGMFAEVPKQFCSIFNIDRQMFCRLELCQMYHFIRALVECLRGMAPKEMDSEVFLLRKD